MDKDLQIKNEELLRDSVVQDFDHNYFVEAGAGAGKTKLVVDRITAQLQSGKYTPEQIVAITFTNKAAQELNERIRGNLKDYADEHPADKAASDALKNIGRMQISTIHSFCDRILRENCFGANLRLDFELLEEDDSEEAKKAFFRPWFNAHAKEYIKITDCIKGLSEVKSITYRDMEKNFTDVCELPDADFVYENYDDVSPEKIDQMKADAADAIKTAVEACVKEIEDGLNSSIASTTALYGRKYTDDLVKDFLKKGYSLDDGLEQLYRKILKEKEGLSPFKGNKGSKKDSAIYNEIAQDAYIATKALFADAEAKDACSVNMEKALVNTLILEFVLKAREEYRKQSFNRFISNDMLLQKTEELLCNSPEVVEKLRRTFKCIYVDEYQDTDPVQRNLILKIGQKGGRFIPGLLFVVGDVKQSIYRFRGADYRLFLETKELFANNPAECKVIKLNINNRSNADLVEFFNEKVAAQVTLIPGYEDMIPRNGKRGDDVIHGVYKVESNYPVDDGQAEPECLVKIIKSLVGKVNITDWDSEKKEPVVRPVEYRDFLILTPKKEKLEKHIDCLLDSGIPARIAVMYAPGSMYPLRRYANIYRYLAMPFYKRAKEGILEIAQQNTSYDVNAFMKELQDWKKETSSMGGAELAGWLLEQGEKYLFAEDDIAGCRIKRFQMAIRQMIDNVISECDDSPALMAKAFLDYVSNENQVEREIGYDKDENAVRLMNIHKAKGLEGNIVIIAQRTGDNPTSSNYTEGNKRYQVTMTSVDARSKHYFTSYELNSAVKNKAEIESAMENARLEYVAVTRAREALIFMAKTGRVKVPKFAAYVDPDIPELFDKYSVVDSEETTAAKSAIAGASLPHPDKPSEEMTEPAAYRISPSGVEIHPAYKPQEKETELDEIAIAVDEDDVVDEPQASEGNTDDGEGELITESSELLQKKVAGDIFGTIMHRAFELAVQGIRKGNCNPALCINRAISENNDDIEARYVSGAGAWRDATKESLEDILPEFIAFIQNDVTDADEVYTEYPFLVKVSGKDLVDMKSKLEITGKIAKLLPADGKESSTILWLSGTADLLIRKGDQLTIWDYKSDLKASEMSEDDFRKSIHSKYDNQMNLYKWVMARKFPCSITGRFYTREIGEAL